MNYYYIMKPHKIVSLKIPSKCIDALVLKVVWSNNNAGVFSRPQVIYIASEIALYKLP